MPIYEYVCNACGNEFEEWQKISDSPVKKCPSCGKRKAERLVSLSAFHLKGGGWYVTDYGGKKPATKGDESKASSAATTKTEEKASTKESPKKTAATSS